MEFLSQNFMLVSVRDRLRYNILSIKFAQKQRRYVIKNELWLHHKIYNSITLENEMTITTQFRIFIKYLSIPPTFCGPFQEWGYPKTSLSNSRKFMRQYEMMTRIGIKTFLTIFVIDVVNGESTGIGNLSSFSGIHWLKQHFALL